MYKRGGFWGFFFFMNIGMMGFCLFVIMPFFYIVLRVFFIIFAEFVDRVLTKTGFLQRIQLGGCLSYGIDCDRGF